MDAWLTRARDALADAAGVPRESVTLDDETARELLDLARIAAHVSGDRRNAPLLCYLVGRVQSGESVAGLADAVRRSTS